MDMSEAYRKHPMVAPIYARIEEVEDRLGRIEGAIGAILRKLSMADLDSFNVQQTPALAAADATAAANNPSDASAPAALKSEPYSYRPLDASQDEIRLLVLDQAGDAADPIKAKLIHVSLNWKRPVLGTDSVLPTFVALSYTWGDPKFEESITLDGHRFLVTRNVEAALRQMRPTK